MDRALMILVIINGMRATHKRNVKTLFYDHSATGDIEDLLFLTDEENKLLRQESKWKQQYSNLVMPEWLSVKDYAKFVGVSTSTVYRAIKADKILATKVKGRWHILTTIDNMADAA